MFASKTVGEHVVRGVLGIGAVVVVMVAPTGIVPDWFDLTGRVLLTLGALVLLRGCPMCWLQGLVETIVARVSGRSRPAACSADTCVGRARASRSARD